MKRFLIYTAAILCSLSITSACTGSFDEVNTDPDRPTPDAVNSTNILAFCERNASDNMFDEWFDLNESCGFSGQISKWMYTDEGWYSFRPSVNSSSWNVCYRTLSNLKTIIEKEDEGSNMWAAATIFACQIFQIASDRWGDIPFSEACLLDDEEAIAQPSYDSQEEIYPSLLVSLKSAVDALDEDGDALGSGDVLLRGNISAWRKYGNALRLRIAARIAKVDKSGEAAKAFSDVFSNPDNLPQDNDDNVFFTEWGGEYPEPWADYYNTRKLEYGASKLMVETLLSLDDPRIDVYAEPTTDWTNGVEGAVKYCGYQNGLKTNASTAKYSAIGNRFQNKSGLTGFSPWLRSCETYFAMAYAASTGVNTPLTQEAAYKKAVTLSILENGLSQAQADGYLAGAAAYDGTQEQLFTQWWISLYKNGMEAWSVYRMSGYPSGNIVAPDSAYPGHNTPPMAYGYPDTEHNLNSANCEPAAAEEDDYFWGKQMWWDTRTGLK